MLYGGNYDFYHCTFANYWNNGNRSDPAVSMNNYFDANVRRLDAGFYNCIVHGNLETELGVDSYPRANPGQFNFFFDHALLKLESTYSTSNTGYYRSIIRSTSFTNSPQFMNINENDYRPDSNSVVIDAGDASFLNADPVLGADIKGQVRPQGVNPDLGAYERR